MTTVRELHREAMALAEDAQIARDAGKLGDAKALSARAFGLERVAVELVARAEASEPTRSILCLSAGSLAWEAGLYDEAEDVLTEGLAGWPSARTRADILELLEVVLYERQQNGDAA